MRTITEDDFSRIVQAFALAAIDPGEWLPALQRTSDTIGAVTCAMEFADLATGEAAMECALQLEGNVLRDYEERIFHINPRVHRAMAGPVGKVVNDHQLQWQDDPDAPEFLDWLNKVPYRYLEGGKILDAGGHIAFFTSQFGNAHGPPGDMERRFHEALMPYVIHFLQAGRALNHGRLRNELVTHHALDSDRPFALLDRAGRLIECSRAFEDALRASDLLGWRGGRLIGRHRQHRGLVERFLDLAVGARRYVDPPLPIRLVGPDALRGLVLRAIPLPPRDDIFDIFRPAALITLTDLDAPIKARRRELQALFGLTMRETDIAALIGEGHTIGQAARTLSISEYTVKQHLKTVFGKMCVERQSDLVALVARLA